VAGALAPLACDDPATSAKKAEVVTSVTRSSGIARAPDAPPSSAPAEAPPDGCARKGLLDGVERDPSCVLARVPEDANRDADKTLALSATIDPPTVLAGGAAVVRVTIANVASTETLVVLDLQARPPGPRTDWSRIAGVAQAPPGMPETPRLLFVKSTLDAHDKSVDAVPTIPGTGATPAPAKVIGVRLAPGARVTHTSQWWAMRIPAPYPPVTDDAGHRFVPKTQPVPLAPGEYTVTIDVPLHDVAPAARVVSVHPKVERATLPKKPKAQHH
jgi:hypothetical protein